jgi:sugar phosphate isomerase/epimerase
MRHQLAYCTNVHAGADLERTTDNLRRYALAVKARFSPRDPMGIGLWLAAPAVRQLVRQRRDAHKLPEFASSLAECGLVPFTLNGFPQGDFHEKVVKHRVYCPTWWEHDRVEYTLDLITALDAMLPAGLAGSISTLPVAWGHPAPRREQMMLAAKNLDQVIQRLARLEAETGRLIHICLEPEPGCVLQRSDDVVRFLEELLWPVGSQSDARRYMRVCHDICHAAVMFEDQQDVLARYAAHGISVGKVQVSSAVRVDFDALGQAEQQQAKHALASLAEERYLHQTCIRSGSDGEVRFFEDLPQALRETSTSGQWRVHFHVPIYLERFGPLRTTQEDIRTCLRAVVQHSDVGHFEVETYAWSVLPRELRQAELADGIALEMRWFADLAASAGL